ncbi:hypothetical protein CYMTET_49179 [Cymbomonas tetramitiformis]|uniref:Uncharacterized protein n=1 Tax=Cymbomonas tetramitiformis TaxID=36881 RepID=A0AAE0BSE2_9CHLO|nr:hypothetical protein CYMTET_49179 [Cymbomonas tetramitiformis]
MEAKHPPKQASLQEERIHQPFRSRISLLPSISVHGEHRSEAPPGGLVLGTDEYSKWLKQRLSQFVAYWQRVPQVGFEDAASCCIPAAILLLPTRLFPTFTSCVVEESASGENEKAGR